MTAISSEVRAAQRRLWFMRWLRQFIVTTTVAAACWWALVVVERVFAFGLPLRNAACVGCGAALVASLIWLWRSRESATQAAVVLDAAAGLKERLSTALHCGGQDDPFARAVVEDAARRSTGIAIRQVMPLRMPRFGLAAIAAILICGGTAWLMPEYDLLGKAAGEERQRLRQAEVAALRTKLVEPIADVKQLVERNPQLKNAPALQDLEKLLQQPAAPIDPSDLRRQAIKKLDNLRDALKSQRQSDRYEVMKETKRRLSELEPRTDRQSSIGRLADALSDGDLKRAESELKKLKDELAKRQRGEMSDEQAKRLSEQLEELSKKLNDLASDKKLAEQLRQAGLNESEVRRALEALAKKDPRQLERMLKELEKRLAEQGASKQRIERMKQDVKQMCERGSKSNQQCQGLGKALQGAAKQLSQGENSGASQQLDEAAEQLSGMEMVEQELGNLESKMSQLDQLKDDLSEGDGSSQCSGCNGSGFNPDGTPCKQCAGHGTRPGSRGRGTGPRPRAPGGDVALQSQRPNVKSRRGTIIGQYFVEGEQLKGEAKAEFVEAADAAVRDAAEALEKDQVPRAYQNAVKQYFDRLGDLPADAKASKAKSP